MWPKFWCHSYNYFVKIMLHWLNSYIFTSGKNKIKDLKFSVICLCSRTWKYSTKTRGFSPNSFTCNARLNRWYITAFGLHIILLCTCVNLQNITLNSTHQGFIKSAIESFSYSCRVSVVNSLQTFDSNAQHPRKW